MVNINLATEDFNSQKEYSYKRGIVVLVVILVLVILVYVGLVAWQKQLAKQLDDSVAGTVANQYSQEEKTFSQSDSSRRVLDFQNRLQVASKIFSESRPISDNLNRIEAGLIPGVYIDSFSFDTASKTIAMDGTANSFNNLAKQILAFKDMKTEKGADYFAVATGKTSVDKDGKITFSLTLKQN